jgi:integrase
MLEPKRDVMARKLKHETSTRYPTICRQWSERRRAWIWGFRLPVSDGPNTKYLHVHEFATQDEARAVVEKLREEQKQTRYGLKPLINRPTLQELIERRLPSIARRNEQTRARRVLYTWLAILDPLVKLAADYTPIGDYRSGIRIEEIQTPHIRQFLERRQADGQTAASINRELNIVAATLHVAGEFFPQLLQWKTPKIPRPKAVKSRRERIISQDEYSRIVAHLRHPADAVDGRRPQDQRNAWQARVRVAQIFEFAMLTGCRHGEIVKLRWADIDWERNKFLVYQTKTGEYKEIPLTASLMAVLEERKPADGAFVFTSGGNIYPKFLPDPARRLPGPRHLLWQEPRGWPDPPRRPAHGHDAAG